MSGTNNYVNYVRKLQIDSDNSSHPCLHLITCPITKDFAKSAKREKFHVATNVVYITNHEENLINIDGKC